MIQTVEAVIDEQGTVRLLQSVRIPVARRALVTILEESPTVEEWNVPRDDVGLLLREASAWDAASDEDALKLEKLLGATG